MTSKVTLTYDDPAKIKASQCECKAGDGHCSNSIGLLYLLCHFLKLGLAAVPPVQSKTMLPQTWHIPQRTEGLSPKPVDALEISKVKAEQSQVKKKRRVTEGILPNLYCPVPQPIPSAAFSSSLLDQLTSINSDAQILNLIPRNREVIAMSTSKYGPVPYGSVLSYQQKPTSSGLNITNHVGQPFPSFSLPKQVCKYTTVLGFDELNVFMGLQIDRAHSIALEEETRQQSHNKTWHNVRESRLTSSVFKRICSRTGAHESLAAGLLKERNIQTAAMRFGLAHEPVAAQLYGDISGNNVGLCGFVINPTAPHLGTSLDRKVYDPNASPQFGLLEVKCPDKDSFIDCNYLVKNKNDSTFHLRKSHQYFYQIMGQMALTGSQWCDLFVKCRQDYHLERIVFDSQAWEEMKTSLDKFFFEYYLPQICHK